MKKTTLWRNNTTGQNEKNSTSHTVNRGSRRSSGSATPEGDEKLPPGWTRKESKSQKGRYYYISPAGKTQWVPPPSKIPVAKIKKTFNWLSEVEICFQEGRLGVSLREVHQMETILYPQFQAEVDDLPKINGKAGPAELHNWSVKPHKRLTIGMRVISIEDTSLAGLTYKEVVQKLKTASRPVRIKFADVQKGTVEENGGRKSGGDSASNGTANDLAASGYGQSAAYMQQKEEYTRVLVVGELHTEMWTIENKKLLRSLMSMQHKWSTVSSEFDILNTKRMELRKENEVMKSDKEKYKVMMKNLKLQATYAIENPELVRANELAKRNTELNDDILKMSSGNKRLRKERDTLQAQLDELEKQLTSVEKKDKDEEEDRVPEEDIFGIEPLASPKEQLSAIKKKRRGLEDELNKEQRKANKVQKEMEQLTKHYTSLGNEESGLSSLTSHQSQSDEKDKNAQVSGGQNDKTSSSGNGANKARLLSQVTKKLAKECQRRRQKIKDELKDAQDELHRLKTHGKTGAPSTRSESTRKEKASAEAATASNRHVSSSSSKKSKRSGSIHKDTLSPSTPDTSSDTTGSSRAGKMPTLSGFLEKGPTEWADRGLISGMKTMRGARERWCVITADGFLKYYKRRGDSVVRGEINLGEKSFEVLADDLRHGKEFVLSTDEQQSHFFTKSSQELNNWVKTLRAANAYLLNAAAPPLPPSRSTRGSGDKHARTRNDSKQAKEFNIDGLEDSLPEEDEQFYGRATLGF
ncbi:unnamed protein product [Peronospora belbahrii]|uniref:WW domain-containing protein n=1 Tax=Peronospora belbahrii TaxID=622444 RepID=A0AAU9L4M4_9STRA|nr:unnamed protein product [Peronospora belbahrii]